MTDLKKSFLQRIRDAYHKRRQEREENKEFDDWLRAPRGNASDWKT